MTTHCAHRERFVEQDRKLALLLQEDFTREVGAVRIALNLCHGHTDEARGYLDSVAGQQLSMNLRAGRPISIDFQTAPRPKPPPRTATPPPRVRVPAGATASVSAIVVPIRVRCIRRCLVLLVCGLCLLGLWVGAIVADASGLDCKLASINSLTQCDYAALPQEWSWAAPMQDTILKFYSNICIHPTLLVGRAITDASAHLCAAWLATKRFLGHIWQHVAMELFAGITSLGQSLGAIMDAMWHGVSSGSAYCVEILTEVTCNLVRLAAVEATRLRRLGWIIADVLSQCAMEFVSFLADVCAWIWIICASFVNESVSIAKFCVPSLAVVARKLFDELQSLIEFARELSGFVWRAMYAFVPMGLRDVIVRNPWVENSAPFSLVLVLVLLLICGFRMRPRRVANSPALCTVCLSLPIEATFVHGLTGHTVCCMACARQVQRIGGNCPICRQPFHSVIRNFLS